MVVEALLAREGERGSRPTGRRDGREGGLRPVEEMEGRASVRRLCCRGESSLSRPPGQPPDIAMAAAVATTGAASGGRPTILYPLHAPLWLLRMETTFSLPYLAAAAAAWRDNFLLPTEAAESRTAEEE